jgi:Aspartyl protease/Tetratricopeptide repeat
MKQQRIAIAVVLALTSLAIAISATAPTGESLAQSADGLFKAGKFANAEKLYGQAVAADTKNYAACVRLGEIALLSNRFPESEKWLNRALEIRADDAVAKTLLAETYYRQDDFEHAAEQLKTPGTGENPGRAHFSSLDYQKMASFKGLAPYQLSGPGEAARLKFVRMEPLPLVTVRINGGKDVVFFVDTGGAELGLDTEFAKELGLPLWASKEVGTFAGGQHIETFHSKIDSIGLGDWTVKNVPVQLLGLRALSSMLGVPRIDGVIGTIFLYHFLSTLDYETGELVLQKRTAENVRRLWETTGRKTVSAPFWMAADHFVVGWGRVDALPPTLFFLDSGLAGAGVNFPESTLKAANIVLDKSRAEKGLGAAGTFESIPYVVPEVLFAGVTEQQVHGLWDGPLFWEDGFGFHIGGMIGHEFLRSHAVTFDFDGMMLVFH